MSEKAKRGAVQPGSAYRRRQRDGVARPHKVFVRYSDEEYEKVLAYAGAARLAAAAYVAASSLRPSAWKVGLDPAGISAGVKDGMPVVADGPVLDDAPGPVEQRRAVLAELIGLHRQLRGACTNLNQAVAKLNALGEPVGELSAIADYVRRVTTAVDEAVAAVRSR